jgi:hypothetical protein
MATLLAAVRASPIVASLLLLAACCTNGAAPVDAALPPSRAHVGARWFPSDTGGSWVWCDVQPVPVTGDALPANALRCQLVDADGACEAWSTYVYPDFRPIETVPAIDHACVARMRTGPIELVEHGRIELHCGDLVPLLWFCQLGRCLGPVPMTDDPVAAAPVLSPVFEDLPCDVGALY